ncbi:MAG: hypothetical protein ACR2PD_04555 [Luminiphilus sp.]
MLAEEQPFTLGQLAIGFARGEAFSNYLLGVDPLAYNAKSSRFFEHRYGQVTAGFIVSF